MAKKNIILCDTSILIHVLRKREDIKENLDRIGSQNIRLSIITVAEIYAGASSKLEFAHLKKYLERFSVLEMNEEVSKIFHGLILNYTLSHRIQIPDAIIAATAIANGTPFYTENLKDFKFIPELKIYYPG